MKNRIRLLATSDVHGYIYPYQYSDGSSANHGFARLATLIHSLRDENTIVIDNGDVLEGSPLSFYHFHEEKNTVSPMTQVMNAMEYDYINIGNHDFNYGAKALVQHLKASRAPLITSNIRHNGKPFGPSYVIEERCGKKIAIFGLVTQYIPNWEQPRHINGLTFLDACESAKHTVDLLQRLEKPDYIICVYHGGFERDLKNGYPTEELTGENEAYAILRQISGIDVLITGHQHRSLSGSAFGTVYTQTADKGQELACIDIYTDTNEIEPRILKADMPADPSIEKLVQEEEARCQKWLDQPLGTSAADLTVPDEFHARLVKSQLITFLNMVQKDKSGADLSAAALFQGASGLKRTITMRDLVSTYVYPNTLVVKKITGKILREYLEKCAEYWAISQDRITVNPRYALPKPQHYNYDMVDGIEYTITVSNDIGKRITELTYNGAPVTDDMEFTICLNNYRASGGGDFTMLAKAPIVREIASDMVGMMAEYIMSHPNIAFEPVNNIRVIKS